MDRQTLIDSLESIVKDMDGLQAFSNLQYNFLMEPHSKKQIREFVETYVVGNFMDVSETKTLYTEMTVESSMSNSEKLFDAITNRRTECLTSLSNKIRNKIAHNLDNTYKLILETKDKIDMCEFPDVGERQLALRRATCKIGDIFVNPRQLPIGMEQFPELEVCELKDYYLTHGLEECIKEVKVFMDDRISQLNSFFLICNGTFPHALMCKNNWISLRNFILYLDSFTEY